MCFNFAAVQDNFGRLHDRSKDTPKTMKQLTRLFPNKVTIQMPQVLNLLIVHSFIVSFLLSPLEPCLQVFFLSHNR